MGIQLSRIRIKNFRSIESLEVSLDTNNVIIGQNNCGKSNFLKAVHIALTPSASVSEKDIYISENEDLSRDKVAIIDIMIVPNDSPSSKEFNSFWTSVFTTSWIVSDGINEDFVGIRTIIQYDAQFDDYIAIKRPIKQWNDSADDAVCGRKQGFNSDMLNYIACYYMDAQRDIIDDLRNKKSYFGKATSSKDMPDEIIQEIESQLNEINQRIVTNTPALKSTEKQMSQIGTIVGGNNAKLQIEPISRKISDLHKGMDVMFQDDSSARFSISDHGMGTRSWISFLTLGAYVNYMQECAQSAVPDSEMFVVLAMEEPEAHLHSNAQKKLYSQIQNFKGQKIVSTHSADIVAQSSIGELVHFQKRHGKTIAHRINMSRYSSEDIAKIQRELIRNKGNTLFSNAIVLSEGLTEELALPIYFKKYFSNDPHSMGVSIIGLDGQKYRHFLCMVTDLSIPWYIFSDGESDAIRCVSQAVQNAYGKSLQECPNVIVLENEEDYEDHLINSGYSKIMIESINDYEKLLREEIDPDGAIRDPREFFEKQIQDYKRKHTDITEIDESITNCILLNVCQKGGNKTKYAECIAEGIVNKSSHDKCIPPKVLDLFQVMNKDLGLLKEHTQNDQSI